VLFASPARPIPEDAKQAAYSAGPIKHLRVKEGSRVWTGSQGKAARRKPW
jgi:hypothetical protein